MKVACLLLAVLIAPGLLSGVRAQSPDTSDSNAAGKFRLLGTVCDEAQAVIPGVKITAIDRRGEKFTSTSLEQGTYRLDLPAGMYTVTYEASGFRTSKVANVGPGQATTVTLNVKLEVGRCHDCNGALTGDRWDDFTTIRGTAFDRFGKGLFRVRIKFTGLDGTEVFASTDRYGVYQIGLPVYPNDTYSVSAELAGFQTFRIERYRLPVMQHGEINLDFVLETVICDRCPDARSVGGF